MLLLLVASQPCSDSNTTLTPKLAWGYLNVGNVLEKEETVESSRLCITSNYIQKT